MKVCKKCNSEKPTSLFYKDKAFQDGLRGWCKVCDNQKTARNRIKNNNYRDKELYSKYRLTEKLYNIKLESQGHKCAICNKPQSELSRCLDVDHNHSSGLVRGLLCRPCNLLLGNCFENERVMQSAIKYLRRFNVMTLSINGLNLIQQFEGFSADPYKDQAGVPTIGFGTVLYQNGKTVTMDDSAITREQALNELQYEVNQKTARVSHLVRVSVAQNQFDALVSFAYNEGLGALASSTLLKLLNSGDTQGAANQFLVWNKVRVDGQLIPDKGLENRRVAERNLFLTPDPVV